MLPFLPLVSCLGLAAAAPSSILLPRQANETTSTTTTSLTFTGASAIVPMTVNVDGSTFQLPTPIGVDFIAQDGLATCRFTGIDGAELTVVGPNTGATLAPPQVVAAGSCA